MPENRTTLWVSTEFRDYLKNIANKGESYEDVLRSELDLEFED